ncbi:MAG: hypothetical protein ACTSRA_10955 [Promethearchaeota archaeon]
MWEAGMWFIRNHHHDSIPGTNTDTVHQECLLRYTFAEQSGTGIAVKKLKKSPSTSVAYRRGLLKTTIMNTHTSLPSTPIPGHITVQSPST